MYYHYTIGPGTLRLKVQKSREEGVNLASGSVVEEKTEEQAKENQVRADNKNEVATDLGLLLLFIPD